MSAAPPEQAPDAPGRTKADRIAVDWIAVDWGTSHLRAHAISPEGLLAASAESDDGMAHLARDGYEPALLRLIGGWLGSGPVQITACGMVGSRQGWAEAPYRTTPCAPIGPELAPVATLDTRLQVRIVPGLRQNNPADVIRGEETQIGGWLAGNPQFDGVICLPGTHSKWVHVSAGEVVSFQTCMTGEMFSLLSMQSVLRHAMPGNDAGSAWDESAFATALDDALSRPEQIAARLFNIRAQSLLAGIAPGAARARLSGLLIGIELAATRPYWLGRDLAIIGAPALSAIYARALTHLGQCPRKADARDMTIAGLARARQIAQAPA